MSYLTLNVLSDVSTYFGTVSSTDIASILVALAIVFTSIVVAATSKILLTRYLSTIVKKTGTTFDDAIIPGFNGPAQAFIVVIGVYVALKTLNQMPNSIAGVIDPAFAITIIFIVAFQVSRLSEISLSWYQKEIGSENISNLNVSVLSFMKKAFSLVIYTAAILMALTQLGVEITPLLASLGIAGIAVALAAQELLSNVFGAFAILTDKPYKVGDRIELSTGEYGDVTDIGLRSTRLLTLDNKVIIIPNADISKSRISNYSEPDPRLRYTVKVRVAYHSDVARASALLKKIATDIEGVLKDPAPIVYIDSLGEYSVNLVMLVWGQNFRKNWDIPDKIYQQALKLFAGEGIEIPYPVTSVIHSEKAARTEKTTE
jgi:Small-conductance mechanosensitive channel